MVDNADVVRTLERVADLLEIKGENGFKVRAYRMAATQVERLSEPLASVAARDGGLLGLEGFGPAIVDRVGELLELGRLPYLEQLEADVPPTLLALCELPGLGPRTAALLWKAAGITSIDELDAAAHRGDLAGIPRLGPRSVERIIAALDGRRAHGPQARRSRDAVAPLAHSLVTALSSVPDAERAEVAGSFRRGRDTVKDLDIVVATRDPHAVLVAFGALPEAERVLLRGDTKCSIEAADGFQIDCRAVAPEEFGSAMQYFTGSQAHNVRLRGRALRMGMTLNEYGLFRVTGDNDAGRFGVRVAGETEEEIYAALGLRWIPPEQRENRGEIDAAVLEDVHVAGTSVRRRRRQVAV